MKIEKWKLEIYKIMSKLPILTYPNPILHQKCSKVRVFDEKLKKLANDIKETLFANRGIGLAAPQVGKLVRLIVIEFDPKRFITTEDLRPKTEDERLKNRDERELRTTNYELRNDLPKTRNESPIPLTILINPKIISSSREKEIKEEGCLSLPGIEVPIERAKEVKILAQDLEGNRIKIRAKGFFSRILQHEIDHLAGILIIDRLPKEKKQEKYQTQPVITFGVI